MTELKGKYGTAKIFTDLVEDSAIDQVRQLLDSVLAMNSKIRMMPDIHAGKGCVIGTTMTIKDKVCPNLVGVDIGCGMLTVKLKDNEIDLEKLDKYIRDNIPCGFNIRNKETKLYPYHTHMLLEYMKCYKHIDLERAALSLGTLGGGNHFIEVDKDKTNGDLYLVIHSGSRHLGVEVAKYYQDIANVMTKDIEERKYSELRSNIISKLRDGGIPEAIEHTLNTLKKNFNWTPKELSYLIGKAMDDYIHDIGVVQYYAQANREAIAFNIRDGLGLHFDDCWFHTTHNYIDTKHMILRKGAVSAYIGEKLLIPINMRDGSLLCVGACDPDWNYSAPHGAGRLMSRSEAAKSIDIHDFEDSMKGIYSTSVSVDTIDESPMAYKPIESIVENIEDAVDILSVLKPIYNFKAGK